MFMEMPNYPGPLHPFQGLQTIPFQFEGLTDAELHALCDYIPLARLPELRERLQIRKAQLEAVYEQHPWIAQDNQVFQFRELLMLWQLPDGEYERVAFAMAKILYIAKQRFILPFMNKLG
jgi:hypothetical protein